MEGYHSSVLLKEVLGALNIRDAWYIDCTLGDGGHSIEIIRRGGKVVGLDVDPQALGRVQKRFGELGYLARFDREARFAKRARRGILGKRIKLIQGNFRDLKNLILSQADLVDQKFAGAIFDLGVSSLQLETPQRGFSFMKEGPLDMRMDPTLGVKALDLVNVLSRKELYELFKKLGEEKHSRRLADAVVRAREVGRIETTRQLAEIVEEVLGRKERINPATRIFQALRIAVNDELNALREGLDQVKDLLEKKGRVVVVSFHSLEDRITKFTFREWEDKGFGEVLTKKPIVPSENEINKNPRSRSAKMRVFKII